MTTGEWIAISIALIAAIPGIGAFLLAWSRNKAEKKKNEAETKKTDTETETNRADIAKKYEEMATRQAVKMEQMQIKIDTLECKVAQLEHDLAERDAVLDEWQAGITILSNQIMADGKKPRWIPEERKNAKRQEATG